MVDCLILNYNDFESTINLLKKLYISKEIRKILVVDNCSTNNSFSELLKYKNEKIDVITSNKNGGYGYGNNFGIKYLKDKYASKYILIANPDIIVEDAVINNLERFIINNKDYAIVAPYMLDKSEKKTTNSGWKLVNRVKYILSFFFLINKIFKFYIYDDLKKNLNDYYDVDAISGSLLLIDVDKFIEVGMYDERVFLYCEETIIGFKLKQFKYRSAILLKDSYIHNHSTSISKVYKSEIKRLKLVYKSRYIVLREYYKMSHIGFAIAYLMSKFALLEYRIIFLIKRIIKK